MMVLDLALPICTCILGVLTTPDISERHHTHHDTYSVSLVISRTLMLVMVFMGVLGALTGWLCHIGVFPADPVVPLAFFVSFQLTLFLLAVAVVRYQVMTYDDHMLVRRAFGRTRLVRYDQIERMRWVSSLLGSHLKDLRIYARDGRSVRVWSLLDVEQLLFSIDRFDVLEH